MYYVLDCKNHSFIRHSNINTALDWIKDMVINRKINIDNIELLKTRPIKLRIKVIQDKEK